MHRFTLNLAVRATNARQDAGRYFTERGEGVVSVAIAVLIMAALGAVAWTAFQALFNDTVDSSRTQIDLIGE
jgi:hypothetical protein